MTTNISVQEITASGLSEPKTVTLNSSPTCDRIQQKLREVFKTDDIFLLNQDLIDKIDISAYASMTFKYYRASVYSLQAGDLVCRNGAILSVKHESVGQDLDATTKHEELSSEECTALLNRLPQMEGAQSKISNDAAPLPTVENILRSESGKSSKGKVQKSQKPLRIYDSFLDYGAGKQFLAFEFNQPVQQMDFHVKSKPELPEGKWIWVSPTRVIYSANRFPGSTEFKLSLGSIVLEDGTKEQPKKEFTFSTAVVNIDSVHIETTMSPVVMVIFNQRIKSKIPIYCVDVAMKPYTPTEDIKTLYKTPSIIAAYEKAKESGVSVLFLQPEKWPLSSPELTFILDSGSHSDEGPLPSKGIKRSTSITSTFTIRPLQWFHIPINTNPCFQFSTPIHPECVATIKDYIRVTTDVEDIIVQGDQICVKVPQKEMEFEVTFKSSLMSADGTILGSDYTRKYKKFRGILCMPTGNAKITNVATPSLQMIAASLKYEYSICNASFDQHLVPQVGASVGGGDIVLPDLNHEMQIFTIDLERYFSPEQKLLAITIPNQATFFVQKTDWIVDTFAHENGIEITAYTKDLKPISNPTIVYANEKGEFVSVKDKPIIPANVTSFKVVANGDWAVFNVPEVVAGGNAQKIDLYATTDRGLYQPGEKAHIIGFARTAEGGYLGHNLRYVVKDGHGSEISKGAVDAKSSPSFDFEVQVPTSAYPGVGEVSFLYDDEVCHQIKFPIKEFRVPDNEVLVSSSQDISSKTVNIDTEVKSFIGDDVTGATTTGSFVVKSDAMSLPEYPEFLFYSAPFSSVVIDPLAKINVELGGSSRIKSSFNVQNSTSLVSIEYKADTQLKNGERLNGNHVANLRPVGLAVGINIKRDQVFSAAFPFSFEAIVIDENNAIVDGANVYFEVWSKVHQKISVVKEFVKQVHRGESIPVALQPGEYFIQAYVSDSHGNVTSARSEVFGIANDVAPKSNVVVTLDKNEYVANEIAKVTVTGLPTYFKRGLCNVYVKAHELLKISKTLDDNGDFSIDIPLHNNLAPRASVYCSIIGFGASVEGQEIHLNLIGSTTLNIRSDRDVKFSVNVNKLLGPAEKSQVTCEFDQPLNEDVKMTVWAVDDAVLKLAKYELEHPMEYLNKKKTQYKAHTSLTVPSTSRQCGWTATRVVYVVTLTGRQVPITWHKDMTLMELKRALEEQSGIPPDQARLIYFGKMLMDDRTLEDQGVLPGSKIYLVLRLRGDGGGGSVSTQEATPITVRKSNGPLAFFKTVNVTKGSKATSFEFEAPTELKRYKIFALAIGATVASKQESVFNVTKPFSISTLVLRHLCIGDKTSFPVTLYNRQEHDIHFKVAARTKSLTVTGAHGFSGTIKANSSTSVEFDLTAAEYLDGAIQVVAVGRASGEVERSDAIEFPVRVKSLSVRRSVFGRFDKKNETGAHTISINEHILGTGEININISPSILSQGVDALTYLGDYRHLCSEQMSSQLLVALPYLTLGSFVRTPNQKSAHEINANIKDYVRALSLRHMGNGRFAYWSSGHNDYSYVNVQVAHALALAKSARFEVSSALLYNCKEYVKDIVENAKKDTVEVGYAAYVLHLMKDGLTKELVEKIKTLGKSAKSVLALAFFASIPETKLIDTLAKKVQKSISSALSDTEEGDSTWSMLCNTPKLCSLTILALLENKDTFKDADLLTRTTGELLNNRVNGHWYHTNANMWSLIALAQYYEKVEKDIGGEYKVKVWLGKRYLGELIPGTSSLKARIDPSVDIKSLPQLTLQLTGAPVWYSAQLKLDSKVGEKPLKDRYTIDRRLYGIENPNDVKVEQKDGRTVYRVKHGAHVAVEVIVQDIHYDTTKFFAVQDPVAAGLEPLEKLRSEHRYYRSGSSAWSHIDIRLDGVDAFADNFYGRNIYSYKALALRKGVYTMPSCHVEEMYKIDNFGDSDTATVIIE